MADLNYIINFASNTLGLDNANSAVGKLGVALAALGVGFAAFKVVGFLSDATKGASEFEQQLATVQAVSGATVEQMNRIKDASVELGESTRYNATQAAEGFEILARAGLNVEDSLATIPSVLALAQGNALELGEAASFVTKAVQGMGLSFDDSGRVADVLAKAAASANTDVRGLGAALSYAAPTAASLGITIEETAAYIGKFADAGIDASRAGTSFNGMLSQFSNDASSFKRELANIGITTNDFNEAIRQLAAAGPKGQKAINALGTEAGPALKALLSQGIPSLEELTEKLKGAGGAAEEQADIMNNTFQGAFAGLDSVWSSVKDTLGEPILEPLSQAFKDIGAVIGELIDSGKIGQLGTSIGEVFTEATVYIVDFIRNIDMAAVIDKVGSSIESLRGISVAANGAFQALSIGANGLKAGFLAIGVAMSMVVTVFAEIIKMVVDGGSGVAKFFGISTDAADKLSVGLGDTLKAAEAFRDYGTDGIAKAGVSINNSFDSIAGKAGETANAMTAAGSKTVDAFGDIVRAADEASKETGDSTNEIRKNVSELIDGMGAPEQFAALLEKIIETGQEAVVGSELINRLIIGAGDLGGRSQEVVEKAKVSIKEMGTEAEQQAEKVRTAIDGTFSALNIDVQQNLNGVNTKTQQTFDLIANGAKSVADSTYSATEKASLLSALFAEGLNAAKTKEEFDALNEVTKHYGLSSVITAEQQKILQAGMKGGADAANAQAAAIDEQSKVLVNNDAVTNANTRNTKDNAEARKSQADATDKAATATATATKNESVSLGYMQQVTGGIKDKISALEALSGTTGQTDAAFNKLLDSIGIFEGRQFLGIQDFTNHMDRANEVITKQISGFEQAKGRADEMTKALSGTSISSRDLADAQHALRQATDANVQGLIRMDSQTLSSLQNAIDGARQRMQGLADDAKNTADGLEATLAKLQGNDDKARDIEQTKKLTELEEKLSEARNRGNNEEAAQLNRALELQKQINREEDKKAKDSEKQSNSASNNSTQSSRNQSAAPTAPKTVNVNLKLGGTSVPVQVAENQESTLMALLQQLQDSKAIAGY